MPSSPGRDIKISIIGAGSAVWFIRVLVDLMLKESLRGTKVYLMDVDEERLTSIWFC